MFLKFTDLGNLCSELVAQPRHGGCAGTLLSLLREVSRLDCHCSCPPRTCRLSSLAVPRHGALHGCNASNHSGGHLPHGANCTLHCEAGYLTPPPLRCHDGVLLGNATCAPRGCAVRAPQHASLGDCADRLAPLSGGGGVGLRHGARCNLLGWSTGGPLLTYKTMQPVL